jgi:Polyketide cyclase / dehydrase and lipid transport
MLEVQFRSEVLMNAKSSDPALAKPQVTFRADVPPPVGAPPGVPFAKVTRTINRPITEVFPKVVEADLTAIFPTLDGVPGIVSTSVSEGWNRAGLERVNTSADGSTNRERLLSVTPNRSFSYEVTEFTAPALSILERISGGWVFTDNGNGTTSIEWIYAFFPKRAEDRGKIEQAVLPRFLKRLETAMEILKTQIEAAS